MSILDWNRPKKVMTTEERNKISADGAPPGVYVPNMSEEDNQRWKAKLIGGPNRRVEIRKNIVGEWRESKYKTFGGRKDRSRNCAQLLCIVDEHSVRISANGTLDFEGSEFGYFMLAVQEARQALSDMAKGD